jgi:hypothetical protein
MDLHFSFTGRKIQRALFLFVCFRFHLDSFFLEVDAVHKKKVEGRSAGWTRHFFRELFEFEILRAERIFKLEYLTKSLKEKAKAKNLS